MASTNSCIQAVADASALHSKHKLLLDSYFLEKGAKPFIGETNKRHLTGDGIGGNDVARWGSR